MLGAVKLIHILLKERSSSDLRIPNGIFFKPGLTINIDGGLPFAFGLCNPDGTPCSQAETGYWKKFPSVTQKSYSI